ncbi:MAG: YggS family pyridoxal phosphate-dependent enzyme [Gemmatimonadota bacterium]|nr:YggS family pyridoxal phosphate-dependent enzyme [Gemmatimonadota bacterium]
MTNSTTTKYADRLQETLPAVRERLENALVASGRPSGAVRLVAVTKGHPYDAIEAALAAGLDDLGENRVEELEGKVEHFGGDGIAWHMIGHVQSRKAGRVSQIASLVHSVDSMRLAGKIARAGADQGRRVGVLAQVNTAREEAKYGLDPDTAYEEILEMAEMPGLRVEGLMAMAPYVDDERILSETFAGLRELADRLRSSTPQVGAELSMGMTNDLEIAIREGSTMVRIGTALFGERVGSAQ